jgi:hypothetical protein
MAAAGLQSHFLYKQLRNGEAPRLTDVFSSNRPLLGATTAILGMLSFAITLRGAMTAVLARNKHLIDLQSVTQK